jgi:hypothetical protein
MPHNPKIASEFRFSPLQAAFLLSAVAITQDQLRNRQGFSPEDDEIYNHIKDILISGLSLRPDTLAKIGLDPDGNMLPTPRKRRSRKGAPRKCHA